MLKRVLLVDTDPGFWWDVRRSCRSLAELFVAGDFPAGRGHLLEEAPDLLVTNLRLGAYNGLHLLHLASTRRYPTRAVVYSKHHDDILIEEAQNIGGFFESPSRLGAALPSYLRACLPERDRRSPRLVDRRQLFRGGRRASDATASPVSIV